MGDEAPTDPDPGAREAPGKRPRSGGEDMKRVAEIVMVLSAMGEMRGGREPTAAEKALVGEARVLLAAMCEEVKPKDLFPKEAVRVVVDDLGLTRSKDPLSGFRPPKMSIADKLLFTKKKMEEIKELTTVHSPQGSQPLPVGFGANSEAHAHSLKQTQGNEIQPAATLVKLSTSSLGRDSHLATPNYTEASQFRLDSRSTMPSYITQVRAPASAEYRVQVAPVLSTTAAIVNTGQENKLLDHAQLMVGSAHQDNSLSSNQTMRSWDTPNFDLQATPGNLIIGHQPSQALNYGQAATFYDNHYEISMTVQRTLQHNASGNPNLTPPSSDYINKPLNCQICKITISDVDSVLVCDACEKGTHLKCLQPYGSKVIPKTTEWHCPKCLLSSKGKPLPPKYGRVTRSTGPTKTSNIVGAPAAPEKKLENEDSNSHNQKIIPNGNSGLPYPAHASNMVTEHCESASDSSKTSEKHMDSDFAGGVKVENALYGRSPTYQSKEKDEMTRLSTDPQMENFDIKNTGEFSGDMNNPTSESILEPEIVSEASCSEHWNDTPETTCQAPEPDVSKACVKLKIPDDVDISSDQFHDTCKPISDESKLCETKETDAGEGDCDSMPHDHVDSASAPQGTLHGAGEGIGCAMPPGLDLHTVDWVGDIVDAADEKTYYRSCRVGGALHSLQDHVLISSSGRNLVPSKLKSLWEDRNTGSKWAIIDTYYFPSDLPVALNRPSIPENREVYASNSWSTVLAGSICGPCEVLSMDNFRKETDRRAQLGDTSSQLPFFLCKWKYDEPHGIFEPIID